MKTSICLLFLSACILVAASRCSQDAKQPAPATETTTELSHDAVSSDQEHNRSTQIDLPPNFRSVLQQEMQEIESGVQLLLNHLARGEAQNAADIAMQIHKSFILKQSLSPEELQQLVSLLPAGFVRMDRAFHSNARKLAEAARQNDFTTGIKIYGEMVQACVSCHTQYAIEKFPGLQTQ